MAPEWVELFRQSADQLGACLCHRMPSHSFAPGGVQLALCARCTGVHLGLVVGVLLLAALGRAKADYPGDVWRMLALLALLAPMGLDAISAGLGFRETDNLTRLATGAFAGPALASLLLVIINHAPARPPRRPMFKSVWEPFGLGLVTLAGVSLLVLLIRPGWIVLDGLSLLGVLLTGALINLAALALHDRRTSGISMLRKAPLRTLGLLILLGVVELALLRGFALWLKS